MTKDDMIEETKKCTMRDWLSDRVTIEACKIFELGSSGSIPNKTTELYRIYPMTSRGKHVEMYSSRLE